MQVNYVLSKSKTAANRVANIDVTINFQGRILTDSRRPTNFSLILDRSGLMNPRKILEGVRSLPSHGRKIGAVTSIVLNLFARMK